MLNIVDFWKQQTKIWNDDLKCGLCWNFSAPLVSSQINVVQSETNEEDCCVHVFLTDIKFREAKQINSVTGLTTSKQCIWNFTLHAYIKSDLGTNNYNEVKGHPIEEGKWNTIFYPLIECLGCDNLLDLCEILGKKVQVTQNGDAVLVNNYLNDVYNGWRINYTFTEIK